MDGENGEVSGGGGGGVQWPLHPCGCASVGEVVGGEGFEFVGGEVVGEPPPPAPPTPPLHCVFDSIGYRRLKKTIVFLPVTLTASNRKMKKKKQLPVTVTAAQTGGELRPPHPLPMWELRPHTPYVGTPPPHYDRHDTGTSSVLSTIVNNTRLDQALIKR